MNDKDFDKILGDKLREERSFKSQDSDWEQLSTRLDAVGTAQDKNNRWRGAAWLWLLMLPILSLLLWEMNDLKNQNKQLSAQLLDVQSQLAIYKLHHDTIIQKVQKTDTLFIYKYLPSKSETSLKRNSHSSLFEKNTYKATPPSVSANNLTEKTLIPYNSATENPILNKNQQDTIKPQTLLDEQKMAEWAEKLANLDKQIADLKQVLSEQKTNAAQLADCATNQDALKKQLREITALADSLKKPPLSTEAPKIDKTLKNNRLFIGIHGGKISYKTTWKNMAGVDIYKNFDSYETGLKLEYALTDKVRLTANGDFCPFSFLIFWQDPRYNLPALQFDPLKEKYLKAETNQTLLQGNIGVKYFFTEGGARWRPFVSVSYSMMHIRPFQTKFTYQPLWGTTNREQIVSSEAVNIPSLFQLSGGLEYRFSKHGVAQAEAFYYKDANKTQRTFDLFGLRASVLLNLKQ